MSVHSHELVSPHVGRPPAHLVRPRRCDALISPSETRQFSRCGLSAMWLLPEVSRCHHHVPTEMIELAQQRAEMWCDLAGEAWQFVLERLPSRGD